MPASQMAQRESSGPSLHVHRTESNYCITQAAGCHPKCKHMGQSQCRSTAPTYNAWSQFSVSWSRSNDGSPSSNAALFKHKLSTVANGTTTCTAMGDTTSGSTECFELHFHV